MPVPTQFEFVCITMLPLRAGSLVSIHILCHETAGEGVRAGEREG